MPGEDDMAGLLGSHRGAGTSAERIPSVRILIVGNAGINPQEASNGPMIAFMSGLRCELSIHQERLRSTKPHRLQMTTNYFRKMMGKVLAV